MNVIICHDVAKLFNCAKIVGLSARVHSMYKIPNIFSMQLRCLA